MHSRSSFRQWQVQAQVAYAGYGITAPELQHDDYQGLEAKGKILLIQLSTPEGTHPHTDFYPMPMSEVR